MPSGIKHEERHVRFITKKLVDNLLSNGQALGKACGAATSLFCMVHITLEVVKTTGLLRNRPRETLCCRQGSVCECNFNSLYHGSRRLSVRLLWFVLSVISWRLYVVGFGALRQSHLPPGRNEIQVGVSFSCILIAMLCLQALASCAARQ